MLGELSLSNVNAIEVERRAACIDLLLTGGVSIQMTCSTLMPLSCSVRERIETAFERAVLDWETSWSRESDASELVVYDNEGVQTIDIPQANHYYDALIYSLERIWDGKCGITDFDEVIPILKLALELNRKAN